MKNESSNSLWGKLRNAFTNKKVAAKRKSRRLVVEGLEERKVFAFVLDPSFGDAGKILSGLTGNDSTAAMVQQPDGKILVAGKSHTLLRDDFYVARYNSGGSLDSTFGNLGRVITSVGMDSEIKGMAIQADGKIVVVGEALVGLNTNIALARYNVDGTLDTTFSGDGLLTAAVGTNGTAQDVAIQADGKIVVVGRSFNFLGFRDEFAVLRFNTDGTLDTTFSGDGIFTQQVGSASSAANAVSIHNNGKIVVVGYGSNGTNNDFAAIRLTTAGVLDTTFSGDGMALVDLGGTEVSTCMLIQSNNRVLIGGTTTLHGGDMAIVRLNLDGTLDTEFSADGIATIDVNNTNQSLVGLSFQPNGQILLCGDSGTELLVARINADGDLDEAFNSGGILTLDLGGQSSVAHDVLCLIDGNILISGINSTGTASGDDEFLLRVEESRPKLSAFVVPKRGWEGTRVNVSTTVVDPNQDASTLDYEWTITGANGFSVTTSGRNASFLPLDEGVYHVHLVVSDSEGFSLQANANFLSLNARPKITHMTVPPTAEVGTRVRLVGRAVDPGRNNERLTYNWTITGPRGVREKFTGPIAQWKPTQAGTYRIVLTVRDPDGGHQLRNARVIVGK